MTRQTDQSKQVKDNIQRKHDFSTSTRTMKTWNFGKEQLRTNGFTKPT